MASSTPFPQPHPPQLLSGFHPLRVLSGGGTSCVWSVLRVFVGGFVDWWMGWWVALVSSLTLCYGSAMRVSGCVPTVPCACVWEGVGSSVLDLILQLVAH